MEIIIFAFYIVFVERESQSMAEDMFSGNVLYVHGIWKVELSEEFKHKIFSKD